METIIFGSFDNFDACLEDCWGVVESAVCKFFGGAECEANYVAMLPGRISDFIISGKLRSLVIEQSGRTVMRMGRNHDTNAFSLSCDGRMRSIFDDLVTSSSAAFGNTVSAQLLDFEYYGWQNERNVQSYERAGKSIRGLPTYVDELETVCIDTSKNPGRAVAIRGNAGYREGVGATMWIGPAFERRTGGDWREMRAYDWCEITEQENGLVRLDSWPEPFHSDQGEQRERQEILRHVLFPKSRGSSTGGAAEAE